MSETKAHPPRRGWGRYARVRRGQPFRHGFAFTLGGAGYIVVALFVGLAAVNNQINLLFLVFGIVLGGMLVSGVISTLTLTGLRVTRRMPVAAMAGQAVTIFYDVRNRKRWLSSYSLHAKEYRPVLLAGAADGHPQTLLACSESYLPHVPPGGPSSQRAVIACRRRGIYRLGAVTIYTRFPFSLFVHFARFRDTGELVVFPAIGRLTHDAVSLILRSRATTQQPLARRGGQDEFYGLREYRHGDNPRWIHWRRSASLGQVMVREMSPLAPRRLVVIISARRPDAAGGGSRRPGRKQPRPATAAASPTDQFNETLEKALSLATTVLHDGLRQGFEVGLLLADAVEPPGDGPTPEQPAWFPASRGPSHWFAMMRALAGFEARSGSPTQPLSRLPSQCLHHLGGACCLWVTCGLAAEEIDQQVRGLAAWHVAVRPMSAEQTDMDELLALPRPYEPIMAGG